MSEVVSINTLEQDPDNARVHTARGHAMLVEALKEVGAGRSPETLAELVRLGLPDAGMTAAWERFKRWLDRWFPPAVEPALLLNSE